MKSHNAKSPKGDSGFKGELVDEKDRMDHAVTGRYINNNPYKTPPNNLTRIPHVRIPRLF